MNKELWLLRHGKSDRDVIMDDFDRPLKKRGKQDARRMGNWMKQQQLIPDVIVCSPANRAMATAKLAAAELGIEAATIRQDQRLYFQGIEQLKAVSADYLTQHRRILLVGHNPDLEDLTLDLTGPAAMTEATKLLPTAALARLLLTNDHHNLKSGCAQLLSITRVKDLSEDK